MKLIGRSIIGALEGQGSRECFYAFNPANRERLLPGFYPATSQEVEAAAQEAHQAFAGYSRCSGRERGAFLRRIAANIESIASDVVERAELETALPKARLQSETARTCGQLRLFAEVVEDGTWLAARIDRGDADRKPTPKPDVRSLLRAVGPVVVFGASNFPLAFSAAGGDTASALAAGNPVIVKAHSAHPGTCELVGRAVQRSVRESGLPEGVFSLLFGGGPEVGVALVKHPLVKAGGFTGSRTAGRLLMDVAAARPEPIPFFTEMSSTNPVFLLPGALRERADGVAAGLHASFTLGAGQFCTKPGLVFLPKGAESDRFRDRLRELVIASAPFHLLTSGVNSAYHTAIRERKAHPAVDLVAEAAAPDAASAAGVTLFETDAASLLQDSSLADEIFGPATVLVHHSSREEMLQAARTLEGHLTATVHGTEQDLRDYAELIAILETKVGRIVFNGYPTGVEVCHAMVHGGPYPATSDRRFTSVGSQAILRFARPVCYQGFPSRALPDELKDENPLGIWRMVDGKLTRDAIFPIRAPV